MDSLQNPSLPSNVSPLDAGRAPAEARGAERRRHKLFVTQNTEYHVRDRQCVAVRDLWTGEWRDEHPAVGRRLFGAVRPGVYGLEPLDQPEVDCLLWFENGENDILTSRLTVVTRPAKRCLRKYPAEAAA
jgi:hypothetical protein